MRQVSRRAIAQAVIAEQLERKGGLGGAVDMETVVLETEKRFRLYQQNGP